MSKSSLEHLIQLLVEECGKRTQLSHVSEEIVAKIVYSLEGKIFSEDNRQSSKESLDQILDPIVDQIYQEEKK